MLPVKTLGSLMREAAQFAALHARAKTLHGRMRISNGWSKAKHGRQDVLKETNREFVLRAFCMNNRISQAFLKIKQEESAASKLAERDRLLRLLPRDRMYQVSKACCGHDATLPPTQLPVSEMQRAS